MRSDEMAVLKAVTIKLSDDVVVVCIERYHTETYDKSSIMQRDRSKHKYQWIARVQKISEIKKKIEELKTGEHAMDGYHWPDDPGWDGIMLFNKSTTNKAAAGWLEHRLKKIVDWDLGLKILDGWKTGGKKGNSYVPTAKYETEEYVAADGAVVSIKDKDTLLKYVGQNLFKQMVMKSQLGKVKKPAPVI